MFWSHYQDETNEPLWAFGHGLSYSNFKYSELRVVNKYKSDGIIEVHLILKNNSKIKGKEVVQLYLKDKFSKVVRPIKELKGFQLVELEAYASTPIKFELNNDHLGFYDNEGKWFIEQGDFEVFVGGSSKTELSTYFKLIN